MLGEWIKQQVQEQERRESDARFELLCRLPANTFSAIYAEWCSEDWGAGCYFNDVFYEDWAIYYASLARDEDYEVLV